MFAKILEYQKTEGALIKLENELSKSGDKEKASAISQELKNYHSRLLVLNDNFLTLVEFEQPFLYHQILKVRFQV